MKRYLSIFLIIAFLLGTLGFSVAQTLKPYIFLFTGRWQPAIDLLLIEGDGFQDIQNLRRKGGQLKGVSGHTKINETIINSTYHYPRGAFHLKKDNPIESHVLVAAYDAAQSNSRIYRNDTMVPKKGEFQSTAEFTSTASPGKPRFSNAPSGTVIYSNENEQKIWGGDNIPITSFIASAASIIYSVKSAQDATDLVTNTLTSDAITVSSDWIIGTTRSLQGVNYHLSSVNASAATLTAKHWNGTTWESLVITDNTAGLTVPGTVTWAAGSTDTESKTRYIEGYSLRWYQFNLSTGSAGIYYVTADAAFQNVRNIWDHEEVIVASFKKKVGAGYVDYTDEVNDDTTTFVAVLDTLATTEYIYLGFLQSQQGFNIWMPAGKENTTGSTVLTVSYWNGSAWTATTALNDGTAYGGISLAQSGTVSFQAIAKTSEFPIQFGSEIPLYYYRLAFSQALDAEVDVYYITGILAPGPISNYKFSELFQERAFLFSDQHGEKNKALYSAFMSPDIYNGEDSGELWFGGDEELTAAAVLYNVYENEAVAQLLVTKKGETYRVFGDGPENWEVQRMSASIGCTAPLSMVLAETAGNRNYAIWQAGHGFVMSDGATIKTISGDIANYFDPNSADYIQESKIDDTVAWFDPDNANYHALISSTVNFEIADAWGDSDDWESVGDGAWGTDWETALVTHNIELEYSLRYNEWTKIYREDSNGAQPLFVGFQARSNRGKIYTYGLCDNGYMYRLENGITWDGTTIEQYVQTKDLLLSENPFLHDTAIQYMRLIYSQKSTAGDSLSIAHYCDGALTVSGTSEQDVPDAFDMSLARYNTQDCTLGPCKSHSIKFSSGITDNYDGIELIGMALYYYDYGFE